MSRTKHSPNTQGKEWWGKRVYSMITTGTPWTWWWKRATHKRERLAARQEIRQALDSGETQLADTGDATKP
jgi:hypothetical protein